MLIDTHAHIYLEDFQNDIETIIKNAQEENIRHIFLPNIDSTSIVPMIRLEERYPEICHSMIGLHPCSVGINYMEELSIIENYLNERDFVAIGEIGLDLYWDKTWVNQQIEAFEYQIELAKKFDLPIVIHTRESMEMTIDILSSKFRGEVRGIFHCFSGNYDQAFKVTKMGFFIGIGGVLTYKNSKLPEIVKEIPLEYIVLETDAPYLSPVPHRGKRNESAYISLIAKKLCEIKGMDFDTVASMTTENALRLFNFV